MKGDGRTSHSPRIESGKSREAPFGGTQTSLRENISGMNVDGLGLTLQKGDLVRKVLDDAHGT